MKLWVKNTILAVILVLIIAVPLLFMGGHEFGGSDDSGACIIVVVVSLGGKQYSFTQSRLRSFHIIKSLQYRSKRKRNHF